MNADTLPLHLHYTHKDNFTLTASTNTVCQKDRKFLYLPLNATPRNS